MGFGFGIMGSGFRVSARVWSVEGLGFGVQDLGCRVKGVGLMVKGIRSDLLDETHDEAAAVAVAEVPEAANQKPQEISLPETNSVHTQSNHETTSNRISPETESVHPKSNQETARNRIKPETESESVAA